jgi:hypothetical protein
MAFGENVNTNNQKKRITNEVRFKGNKDQLTRVEQYQTAIQTKCRFHNPGDVWGAINTHDYAEDIYRLWVNSYVNNKDSSLKKRPATPSNQSADDFNKELILRHIKFGNAGDVWAAVNAHTVPKDLLRVWADSYYGLR